MFKGFFIIMQYKIPIPEWLKYILKDGMNLNREKLLVFQSGFCISDGAVSAL